MTYAQTVARQKANAPMTRVDDLSVLMPPVRRSRGSLTVIRRPCSGRRSVLFLEGALRTPIDGGLRHTVRTLLRSGQRVIVLDLTGVPSIDAAGVGELVRAYNMTGAAQGVLRIVQATARVQRILERAGLFGVLSAGRSRVQLASC